MINTAFTGAAGLRQPLLHSDKTNKLARQRAVLRLLSGAGGGRSRDSLRISSEARRFSRESIVALVDQSANVSREELSYYFANYNNSRAILDAINFGEKVSCGYNPEFKDYGVMRFNYNGSRQIIPDYAVPKMNTGSLPGIHAVNNSLVLDDKSYYAWTAPSGRRYSWAVSNGHIGWASYTNWINAGYKEGDTFSVYGNEYAIDSSGHIHVSEDDTFTEMNVKFPGRSI